MTTNFMAWRWLYIILILGFSLCFTACQSIPAYDQRAWIDFPYQNSEFSAGAPIKLIAHAYADKGVAEVQCSIDGVPYQRGAPEQPGSTFSQYQLDVIINQPGEHILSVTVFDLDGQASNPAYLTIMITDGEEMPAGTALPVMTATAEETAAPEDLMISFWADQDQVQQGSCTSLNWNVQGAESVSLDGGSVEATGSQQVCPSQTTDFTLTASGAAEQKTAGVSVSVISPPPTADQTAPQISNISHTPNKIWNYFTCGEVSAVISAKVSDISAIKRVIVRFRVVKNGETGVWIERTMNGSGGSYQITIGPEEIIQSMSKYGGKLEYTISAEDVYGNSAQSGTRQIEIGECLL